MAKVGEAEIELKLGTKSFEAQIAQTEKELEEWITIYEAAMKKGDVPEEELIKYRKEIEKATNKLTDLKKKQDDLRKSDLSGIGNSITSIIKKIAKWGLALFGIRSMYNLIRQSASTLSQYNDKINSDLQYIRFALASALQPIVERIIDLAYKLMAYVAYIAKAWFNIDLFANASAKAFNKANSNASKLKKTLAGFDELNVLNENGTSGILTPSFDLSSMKNIEIPDWVDWIAQNKALIEAFGITLLSVFGASNIAKILGNIGTLFGSANGKGLIGLLGTLGKIAAIAGAIVVTGYIAAKFLQELDQLKKDLAQIREDGAKFQDDWIKKEEDINKLIVTGNANRTAAKQTLQDSRGIFAKITGLSGELLETSKQTSINIGKQIEKEMELYRTTSLEKDAKEDLLKNILNQIAYNKDLIRVLRNQGEPYEDILRQNKKLVGYANDIYHNVNDTKEDIIDISSFQIKDKEFKVEANLDTAQLDKDYSNWLTRFGDKINSVISKIFKKLGNYSINVSAFGAGGGGGSRAKGGIYYPNYPKLAVGGIINMPGNGVPYHGATIAERGAEAVVPLTDSQQMSYLGQAIGKYVRIDNIVDVSMDSRKINRILQSSSDREDFILNR